VLLHIIGDLAGLDKVADVLGVILPDETVISKDDASGSLPPQSKRCRFLQSEEKPQ